MKTIRNNLLGIVLVSMIVTLAAIILVASQQARTASASVFVGSEYLATTTDATWSTAVTQCKDGLVKNKVLGSVLVTKTSNAILTITDATSTTHSDFATTTIASFPLTTVGEYTFDVRAKRGICVQVDTTVGVASTTITTRN